jgi:hypothetical protein
VFPNIPLYVGAELTTAAEENPNAVVYPSCPSWGWSETFPSLVPRPMSKQQEAVCEEEVTESNSNLAVDFDGRIEADSKNRFGVDRVSTFNRVKKPCPHDTHYYGPCGTIPAGTNMGTEFGWPSADLISVLDKVSTSDDVGRRCDRKDAARLHAYIATATLLAFVLFFLFLFYFGLFFVESH